MTKSDNFKLKLARLVREPTLHFFLIAALVFALYGISRSGQRNLLEIDQREIDARIFMQEMNTGQALSDEQRRLLALAYIDEQILVREAMAMDLDNDARIHDMLAQKMRHVLSGGIIQPTPAELDDHYQTNLERYRVPATVSVEELVFDTREPLSGEVQERLVAGAEAAELLGLEPGNVATLANVNLTDLSAVFEPTFAEGVFAADFGEWVGPFISNRGQHWLQLIEKTPARLPELEEITDLVRLDWIAEEEEVRLQREVNRLRAGYSIVIRNAEPEPE